MTNPDVLMTKLFLLKVGSLFPLRKSSLYYQYTLEYLTDRGDTPPQTFPSPFNLGRYLYSKGAKQKERRTDEKTSMHYVIERKITTVKGKANDTSSPRKLYVQKKDADMNEMKNAKQVGSMYDRERKTKKKENSRSRIE